MHVDFNRGDVEYEAHLLFDELRCGTMRFYPFHTASGEVRIVEVTFPAGIRPSDYVIVPSGGGPSRDGKQRGDMYVRVVEWYTSEGIEGTFTGYLMKDTARLIAAQRVWPAYSRSTCTISTDSAPQYATSRRSQTGRALYLHLQDIIQQLWRALSLQLLKRRPGERSLSRTEIDNKTV